MKNSSTTLQRDTAELQAKKAIQKIKKLTKENYPALASLHREGLIMECLIELTEEKKYLAAR